MLFNFGSLDRSSLAGSLKLYLIPVSVPQLNTIGYPLLSCHWDGAYKNIT